MLSDRIGQAFTRSQNQTKMSSIINASIDLAKIDKAKISLGKNGQEYYNISIMLNDEADKFGNDVSIIAAQSKEERAAKQSKVYLGNGKTVWSSNGSPEPTAMPLPAPVSNNDDLPF